MQDAVKPWCPVVTPFTSDLRPDVARLIRHCRWLLDNDVGWRYSVRIAARIRL